MAVRAMRKRRSAGAASRSWKRTRLFLHRHGPNVIRLFTHSRHTVLGCSTRGLQTGFTNGSCVLRVEDTARRSVDPEGPVHPAADSKNRWSDDAHSCNPQDVDSTKLNVLGRACTFTVDLPR